MNSKLVIFACLLTLQARASSLELEGTSGSQSKTTAVYGSGNFNPGEDSSKNTIFDWSLSFDRARTDVLNSSGETITDNTTDITGGLGFELPSHFRMGAGLNSSSTPEENLKSSGPSVSLGYTYDFSHEKIKKTPSVKPVMSAEEPSDLQETKDANQESSFDPYIAADLNFENLNYVQTFDSKVQRRLKGPSVPVTGSNTITQKSTQMTIKVKPLRWIRLKAAYTKYSYSRDINDFSQYLDTHNVVGTLSSGFSSALSGFYDNTVSMGISFFPHPDWEFTIAHSASKVVIDDSVINSDKLNVYWDITESWRLGLGGSSSKSNTSGSEASQLVSASVGYEF